MRVRATLLYVVRRVISWLVSVLGAFAIVFFLFHSIPGNPLAAFLGALATRYGGAGKAAQVGGTASASMIEAYIRMFGLDKPIPEQFYLYMKNLLTKGDMGLTLINFPHHAQVPIMQALPWTIGLLGMATLIAWTLGVMLGGVLGWRRDSRVSRVVTIFAIAFQQVPSYLLALFLLLTLGYGLAWFPTRGAYTALSQLSLTLPFIWDVIIHSILPALAVVIASLAGWLVSSRSLIISILGEDYLIFAEATGLPNGQIFRSYALRNALLPQVTALGMSLGFVVSGAYLVEYFFSYPGIGWLFVRAIGYLDYSVIQGILFISISVVLTANLILDLVLPLLDPRIQSGAGSGQK